MLFLCDTEAEQHLPDYWLTVLMVPGPLFLTLFSIAQIYGPRVRTANFLWSVTSPKSWLCFGIFLALHFMF